MERLTKNPVIGTVTNWLERWPRLIAWLVLSVGCVAPLVYEARDVGLTAGNRAALIIATVLVTGLCIWIIDWDDDDESPAHAAPSDKAQS